MSPREETFSSPFRLSPKSERYAVDSFYQHEMVDQAVDRFFRDPFEQSEDLRGRTFEIIVHEDGLNVTIREI